MKELEAQLIATQQSIECPLKKMKLSIRIDNDPIDSFGWSDFPLIQLPGVPLAASPATESNFCKRKEHPIICRQELMDDATSSFGWGDFPCVDEQENLPPVQAPLSNATPVFWELPHVIDNSSDEEDASDIPSTVSSRSSLVSFAETVKVREYALTVGDHPYATDAYALSLDWGHSPTKEMALREEGVFSHRHKPRRLTAWERRQRLVEMDVVSGLEC